jgi:hypothetical protein
MEDTGGEDLAAPLLNIDVDSPQGPKCYPLQVDGSQRENTQHRL